MERVFRFIRKESLGPEAIVLVLDEEYLQSFSEANFGRRLSDIELHRFSQQVWDNDIAVSALYDLMGATVEDITKEKDTNWTQTDEIFLKRLDPEDKKECLKEHSELKTEN
jgi:hypothetical protein